MEPMTATALATVLSGMLAGATGEAGARSLQALLKLVKRSAGGKPEAQQAAVESAISEADSGRVQEIVDYLLDSARADAAFEQELNAWFIDARAMQGSVVNNSVSGNVYGSVVQAGVINTDSATKK